MIEANLPEDVHNWLFYAEEDYQSATIMLREGVYNKVCFFSQQCVEKALKAYLLFQNKSLLRTHKIVDHWLPSRRTPGKSHAESARHAADRLLEFVKDKLLPSP